MKHSDPKAAIRTNSGKNVSAHWKPAVVILIVVLALYWVPLFSAGASIQWDAVDVHYSSQKYFSDRLWAGSLPQWTPYLYSGFPFLADPQTGAWYPLNWPFFLLGIGPASIEAELFLHALFACIGAYVLAFSLFRNRWAAVAGALLYGCSGFFAAHSSHVGMIQTAAWLPWLVVGWRASLQPGRFGVAALTGLGAGCMILAGHFQTSLYVFVGLGLAAAALMGRTAKDLKRATASLALIVALAVLISAIQTLPGLELTRESVRARANYSNSTDGSVPLNALLTMLLPDALGALSTYHGPGDLTQYYFYAGILALPLALFGLLFGWRQNRTATVMALAMFIVPLWYALGPAAGLYKLIGVLPGFRNVRAPVHIWFVPALGIALLASAGVIGLSKKFPRLGDRLALAFIALIAIDLFYWNSATNTLAYARGSFDELYGNQEQKVALNLAAKQPALTRFHAAYPTRSFGPLNHSLDLKLESTYGYNPLELVEYADYIESSRTNLRLLNSLNVSRILVIDPPSLDENPAVLARAHFPLEVVTKNPDEVKQSLATLDPAKAALVSIPVQVQQDGSAQARIVGSGEQSFRVAYSASHDSLLRLSIPYFPGWHAKVDGRQLPVLRVDHALSGVVVPAEEHQLDFEFRSVWFTIGALLSILGVLTAAGAVLWGRKQNQHRLQ
jgi:hypothetical protein